MSKPTSMTSKGQVTIPKDVREELGLEPFDKIEIVSDGTGGARLTKVRPRLRELMGSLPANGLSVDDAMERAPALRARDLAAKHLSNK